MLEKIVEAERENAHLGRSAALQAGRDRFYKGDIARDMGRFFEEHGGLYRYEDFAAFTAKVETPVSTSYRGYEVYKNPSASQGPPSCSPSTSWRASTSPRWATTAPTTSTRAPRP